MPRNNRLASTHVDEIRPVTETSISNMFVDILRKFDVHNEKKLAIAILCSENNASTIVAHGRPFLRHSVMYMHWRLLSPLFAMLTASACLIPFCQSHQSQWFSAWRRTFLTAPMFRHRLQTHLLIHSSFHRLFYALCLTHSSLMNRNRTLCRAAQTNAHCASTIHRTRAYTFYSAFDWKRSATMIIVMLIYIIFIYFYCTYNIIHLLRGGSFRALWADDDCTDDDHDGGNVLVTPIRALLKFGLNFFHSCASDSGQCVLCTTYTYILKPREANMNSCHRRGSMLCYRYIYIPFAIRINDKHSYLLHWEYGYVRESVLLLRLLASLSK